LASNENGLISYFTADKKGNAINCMPVDVSIGQEFPDGDARVLCARSCVLCHPSGVVKFEDEVRKLIGKKVTITTTREIAERISQLFESDLNIEKDQEDYVRALFAATGMNPKDFIANFFKIWKDYYTDLTLEQAAKEFGYSVEDFKKLCNGNFHLINLLVNGSISRVYLEAVFGEK
jgi:hypothetical protein